MDYLVVLTLGILFGFLGYANYVIGKDLKAMGEENKKREVEKYVKEKTNIKRGCIMQSRDYFKHEYEYDEEETEEEEQWKTKGRVIKNIKIIEI